MKQLVILACYVGFNDLTSEMHKIVVLKGVKNSLDKTFDCDLENETGIIVKTLIIPVENQETKIECIYPRSADDKVLEKLDDLENKINDFFRNRRTHLSKNKRS